MAPSALSNEETIRYQLTRDETASQLMHLVLMPRMVAGMTFLFISGLCFWFLPVHWVWSLALLLFPILLLFFLRLFINRILIQHPELLETQTLTFGCTGLSIMNSVSQIQWPWNRVKGAAHTKDFYVFRFDCFGSGVVIPRKSLTKLQAQKLLAYAQEHHGK